MFQGLQRFGCSRSSVGADWDAPQCRNVVGVGVGESADPVGVVGEDVGEMASIVFGKTVGKVCAVGDGCCCGVEVSGDTQQ